MDNKDQVLESFTNGVKIIKLNRPEKKNAINTFIYTKITQILNQDATDDRIVVTVLSGVGDYFSSGNDIVNAISERDKEGLQKKVEDYVNAFINYPKLLIAVVNGPAVGIAATCVALCDIVFATEDAFFHTPFLQLGLCPEACSTYTFPAVLGTSVANEMLFLGKKLSAREALERGFISAMVKRDKLDELFTHLTQYGNLPINSLKITKKLLRGNTTKVLCECSKREFEALSKCTESEEFMNAVITFINKRSKL